MSHGIGAARWSVKDRRLPALIKTYGPIPSPPSKLLPDVTVSLGKKNLRGGHLPLPGLLNIHQTQRGAFRRGVCSPEGEPGLRTSPAVQGLRRARLIFRQHAEPAQVEGNHRLPLIWHLRFAISDQAQRGAFRRGVRSPERKPGLRTSPAVQGLRRARLIFRQHG